MGFDESEEMGAFGLRRCWSLSVQSGAMCVCVCVCVCVFGPEEGGGTLLLMIDQLHIVPEGTAACPFCLSDCVIRVAKRTGRHSL